MGDSMQRYTVKQALALAPPANKNQADVVAKQVARAMRIKGGARVHYTAKGQTTTLRVDKAGIRSISHSRRCVDNRGVWTTSRTKFAGAKRYGAKKGRDGKLRGGTWTSLAPRSACSSSGRKPPAKRTPSKSSSSKKTGGSSKSKSSKSARSKGGQQSLFGGSRKKTPARGSTVTHKGKRYRVESVVKGDNGPKLKLAPKSGRGPTFMVYAHNLAA